jgi:hypothetical protein
MLLVLATCMLAACAGATSPQLFEARPSSYLLTIDELQNAEFQTIEGPAAIGASAVGGNPATGARLAGLGLEAAASVRFFRVVSDVSTTNGPLDVTASVARYRDVNGAAAAFALGIRQTESRAGEQPVSTGPLGDAAHADQVSAKDASGTILMQFTVTWRLGNLVNVVIIRGRYGGARITDALTLADAQVNNELGEVTFAPTPSPSPTPAPTTGPAATG